MQMDSLIVQEWKLALGGAMQQTSASLIIDIASAATSSQISHWS